MLVACSAGDVAGPDAGEPSPPGDGPSLVWESGAHPTSFVLHNVGAAAAPLDLFTATGGFTIDQITCDELLAAGARCTIELGAPADAFPGALTVISDGASIATSLQP